MEHASAAALFAPRDGGAERRWKTAERRVTILGDSSSSTGRSAAFAEIEYPGIVSSPRPRRALAAYATAALLVACGGGDDVLAATGKRHPVVVVGIDGATWDLVDPMMARGELPHFRSLVERGTRARLISIPPSSSPVVWTTVATGTFARSHEILGFTYPYSGGRGRPVSSDLRRDPAIWNVASEYGRRVGVVGYFASHPPERVNGFVVSDRIVQGVSGSTYPPELQSELRTGALTAWTADARDALNRRFFPWDFDPDARLDDSDPFYAATRAVHGTVDHALRRDEVLRLVSVDLARRPLDLFVCYFRIVDHACHSTWKYFEPERFERPPVDKARELLENVIPEAYRYVDEMLGELLVAAGEDVNVVVLSDHGFGPDLARDAIPNDDPAIPTGSHRVDGLLLAAGPDIRQGELDLITTIDVAPNLLALLGVPVSDELPGEVAESLFRPGFLEDHPLERVEAWNLRWEPGEHAPVDAAAEEEALDVLQGLGYIGDVELDVEAAPVKELDFWGIRRTRRESVLAGEMAYLFLRGRGDEAYALLELARARDRTTAKELPGRVRRFLAMVENELGLERGTLAEGSLEDED